MTFSGVDTLHIEPGSPWENGYAESFHSRMRDRLLEGGLFLRMEAKYVVDVWKMDYNHCRTHSSLGYVTLAACAKLCREAGYVRPYLTIPDEGNMRGTLIQKSD